MSRNTCKPCKIPSASSPGWLLAIPVCLGLTACILLLGIVELTSADVGPVALDERGYTLSPVEATHIQMISETVLIEVIKPVSLTYYSYAKGSAGGEGEIGDIVGVQVTADFLFRNPETETQGLMVGFPLTSPSQAELQQHLYIDFYPIQQLHAFVNGQELETRQETVDGSPWRVWHMEFPPGDTQVRVAYLMSPFEGVGYILHTGAPWAGPIGQVDLTVRFPCPVGEIFMDPPPPPGHTVEGHDLRWHYENLEPTQAEDLFFHFAAPSCWDRQPPDTPDTGETGTDPTPEPTDRPDPTTRPSTAIPSPTREPTATPTGQPMVAAASLKSLPSAEPSASAASSKSTPIVAPPSAASIPRWVWGGIGLAVLTGATLFWLGQRLQR